MNKVLDSGDRAVHPAVEAMRTIRSFFDLVEEFAQIYDGSTVLRSEYEVLVVKVPSGVGLEGLAAYLLDMEVTPYRRGHSLYTLVDAGDEFIVAFRAAVIHREPGYHYIAVEPTRLFEKR